MRAKGDTANPTSEDALTAALRAIFSHVGRPGPVTVPQGHAPVPSIGYWLAAPAFRSQHSFSLADPVSGRWRVQQRRPPGIHLSNQRCARLAGLMRANMQHILGQRLPRPGYRARPPQRWRPLSQQPSSARQRCLHEHSCSSPVHQRRWSRPANDVVLGYPVPATTRRTRRDRRPLGSMSPVA